MKVFIIGAGFSKAAGYPLGNEMLAVLGEYVEQHRPAVHLQSFWKEFVNWKDTQTDVGLSDLINTGNVELITTQLDLLLAADEANFVKYCLAAKVASESERHDMISEREIEIENSSNYFSQVKRARDRLRRLLVDYFEHQDYEDSREENQEKYRYILELCRAKATGGDVFITFNYDTLLERALYSLGGWSPSDGYGFEVNFKQVEQWRGHEPASLGSSEVSVLKLHGSVGWYLNEETNKIFLNWGNFLQHFIPGVRDSAEPDDPGEQYDIPFVIDPSFIKPIEQEELLNIWGKAKNALENANEALIIGYSMPQADASAQNLIVHSLRANRNNPRVTVVDPNPYTTKRYEKLLGFKVEEQRYKVEDWVLSSVGN